MFRIKILSLIKLTFLFVLSCVIIVVITNLQHEDTVKQSSETIIKPTMKNLVDRLVTGDNHKIREYKLEIISTTKNLEKRNNGEMGRPVILSGMLTENIKNSITNGWKAHGFNQYVSDLISVHRQLRDRRHDRCKSAHRYLDNLPNTSVIICFHNEAWSTLLRTVYSVLDRSPPHFIAEVILVDDFSDLDHLKDQLDQEFGNHSKVKIVRSKQREGLIRARLIGARFASGKVLTFLDSHCECSPGWLEPLLDRIARDPTTVACPVIDVIDGDSFQYKFQMLSGIQIGGFDWTLAFRWRDLPSSEDERRDHPADAIWSPTMAGGLFSIDKNFFEKLGTYDSGLDLWGGENLELSFKTWMCGGTLEILPCSHVGHVFRNQSPYDGQQSILKRNKVRLSEVWLDEYATFYYKSIGNRKGNFGDVSERKKLRDKLNCKSFKWYMENICPHEFDPIKSAVSYGEIWNYQLESKICIHGFLKKHMKPVVLMPCHGLGYHQFWMYTKTGEIRKGDVCLENSGKQVIIKKCHGEKGNQFWKYNENTKHIHYNGSNICMTVGTVGSPNKQKKLMMMRCKPDAISQKWYLENYNATKYQVSTV